MMVVWWLLFVIWIVWFIGYPIYKKITENKNIFSIKDQTTTLDFCLYSLGLSTVALMMNIVGMLLN